MGTINFHHPLHKAGVNVRATIMVVAFPVLTLLALLITWLNLPPATYPVMQNPNTQIAAITAPSRKTSEATPPPMAAIEKLEQALTSVASSEISVQEISFDRNLLVFVFSITNKSGSLDALITLTKELKKRGIAGDLTMNSGQQRAENLNVTYTMQRER